MFLAQVLTPMKGGRAMDQTWVQSRPHLQNLVAKMQAVLEMADALYAEGQRSGEAVNYGPSKRK